MRKALPEAKSGLFMFGCALWSIKPPEYRLKYKMPKQHRSGAVNLSEIPGHTAHKCGQIIEKNGIIVRAEDVCCEWRK